MNEETARFEVMFETIRSDIRVFGDKVTALSDAHDRTNERLDRLDARAD